MCRIGILSSGGPLIFRQLFENISSTYTYLIADSVTKEAALIDPVLETVDRDLKLLNELGLRVGPIINTHLHADHVTGSGLLKHKTGGFSVLGHYENAKADRFVKHGDSIKFGIFEFECRATPGHTPGCMSLVLHKAGIVMTGDALFIRGCGRTDFQDGCSEKLYHSVHSQLFTLPDDYLVFPAHDYTGRYCSTVGEEKQYNSRFTKSLEEFVQIMKNLNLPNPKQMDRAIPLNLKCGLSD